jgi:hypothetical protein
MAKKRPASVLVIAIFQLVFGSLGLCGSVLVLSGVQEKLAALSQSNVNQGTQTGLKQPPNQQELEDAITKHAPSYPMVKKVEGGAGAILSLVMIVSGIGLLQMQTWGRFLTIGYAVVSLLYRLVDGIYVIAFVAPAMSAVAQEYAKGGGQQEQIIATTMQIGAYSGLVGVLLTGLYPLFVLIIMLLPSVGAAFRGQRPHREPEDYDDRRAQQRGDELDEPEDRFRASDR